MAATYKTTGINLRAMAMGESDRLMTILTVEQGLIRVVAPGAKKMKSSLRGRMELFVINDLLIVSGKGLDRVIQADTVHSFPKLSRSLVKLAASQYLAELAIAMTTNGHEEAALYQILIHHC
ncbi:MAG: DNA repair protein RecO [Synechococcaceae cyanobacterium RL_1_2]|nr:DNA repair protein RecO [Synechococcaceae cyanobacterium RL_1_2]